MQWRNRVRIGKKGECQRYYTHSAIMEFAEKGNVLIVNNIVLAPIILILPMTQSVCFKCIEESINLRLS